MTIANRPSVIVSASVATLAQAHRLQEALLEVLNQNADIQLTDLTFVYTAAPRAVRKSSSTRTRAITPNHDGLIWLRDHRQSRSRVLDARTVFEPVVLDQTLINIGLKPHTYMRIRTSGLRTIGDLRMLTADEIHDHTTTFGYDAQADLAATLRRIGLKLIGHELKAPRPGNPHTPIEELKLSTEITSRFAAAGLTTLGKLASCTSAELIELGNWMRLDQLSVVKCALYRYGFLLPR